MVPDPGAGTVCNKDLETRYEGANAVQAFNDNGGQEYAGGKAPVENCHLSGGTNSHWRKNMRPEVMAADIGSTGPWPISPVSVGVLEDIGYQVNYDAADAWTFTDAASREVDGDVPYQLGSQEDEIVMRCQHGLESEGPVHYVSNDGIRPVEQ